MKASRMTVMVSVLTATAMICSCETLTMNGPAPEEQVMATLQAYKAGWIEQDIDKIMATYSDDFTNPAGGTKAGVRTFFDGYKAQGVMQSTRVNLKECKITIDGDIASASPVKYHAASTSSWLYRLKKDADGVWRIISSRQVFDDIIPVRNSGFGEIVESEKPERIASGFGFTEGPVWHPDGYLLFSDIPMNIIRKWTPDKGVETFRSPSGNSNGLTYDKQARLIACEHSNRRVSRTDTDGVVVAIADRYEGKRLNSPNDAVVKSDGSIYFTDPPYGLPQETLNKELDFQGVYRLLPDDKAPELLVSDLNRPNGIAFSPDEKVLYVANSSPGNVYAFDVQADGSLANRRSFTGPLFSADGIKVDTKGNLYVTTGLPLVKIYDNTGRLIGDILFPEVTANCAFGGSDGKTLFVTASTSVYKVRLKVQGIAVLP